MIQFWNLFARSCKFWRIKGGGFGVRQLKFRKCSTTFFCFLIFQNFSIVDENCQFKKWSWWTLLRGFAGVSRIFNSKRDYKTINIILLTRTFGSRRGSRDGPLRRGDQKVLETRDFFEHFFSISKAISRR